MISPLVSAKLEEMRRTLHASFELVGELPGGAALVTVTPFVDESGEALPAFSMLLTPLASCDIEEHAAN